MPEFIIDPGILNLQDKYFSDRELTVQELFKRDPLN